MRGTPPSFPEGFAHFQVPSIVQDYLEQRVAVLRRGRIDRKILIAGVSLRRFRLQNSCRQVAVTDRCRVVLDNADSLSEVTPKPCQAAASMTQRAEIERILHAELEQARFLCGFETDQFRVARKRISPADANYADGTAAIRTAVTERRSAVEALSLALKRFSDFIINGVVPDDLKK
jgi:hypothetical protein